MKKRPASAARTKRWRENALKRKNALKNVRTRARRSARKGKPYQTKSPKLQHVAAAAYAAEAAAYKYGKITRQRDRSNLKTLMEPPSTNGSSRAV